MKTTNIRNQVLLVGIVVSSIVGGWFGGDFMKWIIGLPEDSFWRGVLIHEAGYLLIAVPLLIVTLVVASIMEKKRNKDQQSS